MNSLQNCRFTCEISQSFSSASVDFSLRLQLVCFSAAMTRLAPPSLQWHQHSMKERGVANEAASSHCLFVFVQMPEFEKSTVHIRDPERVEQIICSLIKGGAAKLQVTEWKHTYSVSRTRSNDRLCFCSPDHHRFWYDIKQVCCQWKTLPDVSQWVKKQQRRPEPRYELDQQRVT